MVSLLMLLIFLMIVTRVAGSCLRFTERSLPRGCRGRHALGPEPLVELSKAVPPKAETPLESLQRRFAEGKIGVEHYEREVGRLYGLKSLEQDPAREASRTQASPQ